MAAELPYVPDYIRTIPILNFETTRYFSMFSYEIIAHIHLGHHWGCSSHALLIKTGDLSGKNHNTDPIYTVSFYVYNQLFIY